jgi:hypothetical protein
MANYTPPDYDAHATLELGVKVSTTQEGWIKKVYFYKYKNDTGGHSAHIWSSFGTLLASQDFVKETASGWQNVALDKPVRIAANQSFTVSVSGATFYYAGSTFPNSSSGPLTVIDGYYRYYSFIDKPEYPRIAGQANYSIDFNFSTDSIPEGPDPPPPVKPSKPLSVQASTSGIDITVSWLSPAKDGGSPISGYTVMATNGSKNFTCTSTPADRSCTLKSLPAGRQYSITVAAFSDSGKLRSLNSDAINTSIGIGVLRPELSAPRVEPITYGQSLADAKLIGGTSNVPGTFRFKSPDSSPEAGTATALQVQAFRSAGLFTRARD